MAMVLNELSAQQRERSQQLLRSRRRSRIALVSLSYGLAIVSGVTCAAVVVGENGGPGLVASSGLSGLLLLVGIFSARHHIRQSNRALDQCLDIMASARAMAIEAHASQVEQDRLSIEFRELQDRRSRGFLGRRERLI